MMNKLKYWLGVAAIALAGALTSCNFSVTKNYTLTVKYDEDTVLFETNYNNTTEVKEASLNTSLTTTDIYNNKDTDQIEFDGYKAAYTATSNLSFPFYLNKDTTIYASYYHYYLISFDTDGGSAISTVKTSKNKTITAPSDPTKEGYTFDGWYNNANYDVKINFNQAFSENTTLYAKWNENVTPITEYTVTFDSNGGSAVQSQTTISQKITEPEDPTKEGYTFDGWYTDTTYTKAVSFDEVITKNTTYYAKWTLNTPETKEYTVQFVVNLSTVSTITVTENSCVSLPSDPVVSGYRFDKWTDEDGNIFTSSTKVTKNMTVSAVLIKQYTVRFVDKYYQPEDITTDENTKITLPVLTKDGYTLEGWYTDSALSNKFDANDAINQDLTLYSKWSANSSSDTIVITASKGYSEGAYLEFNAYNNANSTSNYKVTYQKEDASSATSIDAELIRKTTSGFRADILGLTSGNYTFTITETSSNKTVTKSLEVYNYDRSGYAHYNYTSGVGAYNDDGSLKSNAVVIYVTDANKNSTFTVGSKSYSGLVKLLQANLSIPLCIRFIGTINAATWNLLDYRESGVTYSSANPLSIDKVVDQNGSALPRTSINGTTELKKYNSMSDDIANGITELNNLTNKISYSSGEYDSYFNMCDISGCSNITVEGVGEDSGLYQWGFTWSKCNSIEVRNLTFTDNTEDACSFQGGSNSDMNYGHYWVHNCVFNRGKNNWDVCPEQDKHYGDGSVDLKYDYGTTLSYNVFNNCKKTGLIGGGDSAYTRNVSFHHNYYNQVGSRLPLGRQANMHIYNNYYYKCTTCQDIRANAFVLSEANYFEDCQVPQKVTTNSTYAYTVIKSYGDYLTSGCGTSQATKVTSRDTTLTGLCKPDGSTNYTNFDTNTSLFYYDATNKKSNVDNLFTAEEAKTYALTLTGPLGGMIITKKSSSGDSGNTGTGGDSGSSSGTTSSFQTMTLSFPAAGDYTSDVSCGTGFTLKATSSKKVTVSSTNIALNGGGSTTYRAILANVGTTEKLKLTFHIIGGSGDRKLRIADVSNNTLNEITITGGDLTTTVEISGYTTYYFYSVSSGLYIYSLSISAS